MSQQKLQNQHNKLRNLVRSNLHRLKIVKPTQSSKFENLMNPFKTLNTFINSKVSIQQINSSSQIQQFQSNQDIPKSRVVYDGDDDDVFFYKVDTLINKFQEEGEKPKLNQFQEIGQKKNKILETVLSMKFKEKKFQDLSNQLIQRAKRNSIRIFQQQSLHQQTSIPQRPSIMLAPLNNQQNKLKQSKSSHTFINQISIGSKRLKTERIQPITDRKDYYHQQMNYLINDIDLLHKDQTKETEFLQTKCMNFKKKVKYQKLQDFQYLLQDAKQSLECIRYKKIIH